MTTCRYLEFPFSAFLDHLFEIAQAQAEGVLEDRSQAKMVGTSGSTTRYLVLKAELDLFTESLEESLGPLRVKLSHRLNTTARREPRRRTHSNATSETARFALPFHSVLSPLQLTRFSALRASACVYQMPIQSMASMASRDPRAPS